MFSRRFALLAAALLLAGCGGGSGSGTAPPAAIGRTESFAIDSARTGGGYPIDVYLPPQYDTVSSPSLPVIYAVDGDARFGFVDASNPNVTRFTALKEVLQRRGTAAILVGVGGTARRNTDFLPPGSLAYHAFLTQELVPAIEARYRAVRSRRILSGLSYGGTITFLAFTYEAAGTATFTDFWATETAAPNGDAAALPSAEAALWSEVQSKPLGLRLFLGAGAPGNNTNGAFVRSLYAQMAARGYQGLDLQFAGFATDHVGTDLPAFEEALKRFGPQ